MTARQILLAVAVFSALIIGGEAMIRLDPELQAPTRGVLAEVWRALRDGGGADANVAGVLMPHLPPGLRADGVVRWIQDDLLGQGRSRLKRFNLFCPLAKFARYAAQCDLVVGRDPCLFSLRVIVESETERGPITRLIAIAKRCHPAALRS